VTNGKRPLQRTGGAIFLMQIQGNFHQDDADLQEFLAILPGTEEVDFFLSIECKTWQFDQDRNQMRETKFLDRQLAFSKLCV
jgi:hypothetical protein